MEISERIENMSVPVTATVRDTMRAIDAGACGTAILTDPDNGAFRGVVTDGDVRRALLKGCGLESQVTEVPRPESKSAPIDTPLEELVALFSDTVRIVPLLDGDKVVDLTMLDRQTHLPVAEPNFTERELQYVSECVLTGWVSSAGSFVTRFERQLSEFCGTAHAVATCNGTAALHLALRALDIGPGDEVIVPSFTFIATANAVRYTGATPVFVDSLHDTWCMDPAAFEAAITEDTRAVIPVHIYGHPCDMEAIHAVADVRNIHVIEDAAEAQGAKYRGRAAGGIGTMGVFSFYGNKIITTGEGGMVVTNDDALADRLRLLRDHGMSRERRYWHPELGFNYRLTNLQAALGVAQMERIDAILATRAQVAAAYEEHLRGIPGLSAQSVAPGVEPVCWLYSVLVNEQDFGMDRDTLIQKLEDASIGCRPLFPPMHIQPIYRDGSHLPVAERLGATGLSLPTSPTMDETDIERIADSIRKLCAA